MLHARVRIQARSRLIAKLAIIAVVTVLPLRAAHAYVDPNSAGPLYQMLFPMLVAIASFVAAGKRGLKRLWNRIVTSATRKRSEASLEHSCSKAEEGS